MNESYTKTRMVFQIEFLKWHFSRYWQVQTRQVFTQTVTFYADILAIAIPVANYSCISYLS